jgi:hypothetical protein
MNKQQEKRLNIVNKTITLCAQYGFHGTSIADPTLTLEQKLSERFEILVSLMKDDLFNGCYFQLAYSEFNHIDDNIAKICSGYKNARVNMIKDLLTEYNIHNAELKSQQAELIFNGLLASLQITKNTQLIPMAKEMYLNVIFNDNK